MKWIENHLDQIVGVLAVAIILTVGRAKILPAVKRASWLMWVAWAVTVACGLVLGWALLDLVRYLTGLGSLAGSALGSIGALVALALGWHGVYLLIAMIRDLVDRTPDEDARKAALWVPTFLPAGVAGVWGIVTNPQGLGTGLTAAAMALITLIYTHLIINAVLKGKTGAKGWKWFAAGVCLLAGLTVTPLLLFLDGLAADHLPGQWLVAIRVLIGVTGLGLAIAALVDIADRIPDKCVRAFLRFGLPIVITFGALAVSFLTGHAADGGAVLTGGMK
jgi:hypothetical protein